MKTPHEFKVMRVRECIAPSQLVDTPQLAFDYWKANIPNAPWYDESKEVFVILILNTRRRVIGHNLVAIGTLDSVNISVQSVFRPIIVSAGAAAILMHNHPSLDSSPSDADIKVTRDLIRASKLIKIEILDHVIIGEKFTSLRELGYLYE